jgi:hypothetical protein
MLQAAFTRDDKKYTKDSKTMIRIAEGLSCTEEGLSRSIVHPA